MSSGVDVRRRPGIWSYFSFSSTPPTHRRRVSSVSLSNTNPHVAARDPYARRNRHSSNLSGSSATGFMKEISGMNQGQRSRYLKAGGLIAFIVLAFYFLAPSKHLPGVGPFPGGDVASESSTATQKCTKSYSSSKPLIQYALMIDAGSTGSRIHVYRFNNCGPSPELEDEVFKMTEKKKYPGSGLSSFAEDSEGAAASLDVLMDTALESVPPKLQRCTPVAVKATAGLRKLGEAMSNRTLAAVRNRLETKYPFPVLAEDKGGVEVMDGSHEGVYAWITTNYLLGKIGGPDKSPTAAVLDLGGGSTQIVFEPTFKEAKNGGMPEKMADGDHKYDLSFGGRDFALYQHSYLGYGLMEARNHLNKLVLNALHEENKESGSQSWLSEDIPNPCYQPGQKREVKIELEKDHPLGATVTVTFAGPKTASPAQCRGLAEKALKKDADCKLQPCAFNGIHQPSISKTFAREDVYLLSYFYDRIEPLGMASAFTIAELRDLADRVCAGEASGAWDVFHSFPEGLKELQKRANHCQDLNFMFALLHHGYEMPIDREVRIAKKIKGNELGWCLGASLPLLSKESGWQCSVKQVN